MAGDHGIIHLVLYDGRRLPLSETTEVTVYLRDGEQHQTSYSGKGAVHRFEVPFSDGPQDAYAVIATANGYETAGFFPVNVNPHVERTVFLMLLPRGGQFNFANAQWQQLPDDLRIFLARGAATNQAAQAWYVDLIELPTTRPILACLLNITTAMRDIDLPENTAFSYFRQLIWDGEFAPRQDRFFAYADRALIKQVQSAAQQKAWAPEPSPGLLHPGATLSYKQLQFGEANVQLTFHEHRPAPANMPAGEDWVFVEPDIDYYKDRVAHTILEVVPGFFSLTDPKQVYVLRWIAGRQANVPAFNPLYTIVAP